MVSRTKDYRNRVGLAHSCATNCLPVRRKLITPETAARFFRVPFEVVQAVWPRVPFAVSVHVLANSGSQTTTRQYVSFTENPDPANILTEEELIERLNCSKEWLNERRRKRCWNPIPYIPLEGRIRYYWPHVSRWMQSIANFNEAHLHRRAFQAGFKRDQ